MSTIILFEGTKYDIGDAIAAYDAGAFLLPGGKLVRCGWLESMPPIPSAVQEVPWPEAPTILKIVVAVKV